MVVAVGGGGGGCLSRLMGMTGVSESHTHAQSPDGCGVSESRDGDDGGV